MFLLLFTVTGCIVDAFFCNPPRFVYDINWVSRLDRAEHCFSNELSYAMLVYQGAVSFATDLSILLLPIPALARMTVSRGKWFALGIVFMSGKRLFVQVVCYLGSHREILYIYIYVLADTQNINAATVASITPILRLMNAKFQRDTGVTDLTCMATLRPAGYVDECDALTNSSQSTPYHSYTGPTSNITWEWSQDPWVPSGLSSPSSLWA